MGEYVKGDSGEVLEGCRSQVMLVTTFVGSMALGALILGISVAIWLHRWAYFWVPLGILSFFIWKLAKSSTDKD